jgi:hypothetical protein
LAHHTVNGATKADREPDDPCAMLSNIERERVYRVRKAVAEGNYDVSADALATKLIESMLNFAIAAQCQTHTLYRPKWRRRCSTGQRRLFNAHVPKKP